MCVNFDMDPIQRKNLQVKEDCWQEAMGYLSASKNACLMMYLYFCTNSLATCVFYWGIMKVSSLSLTCTSFYVMEGDYFFCPNKSKLHLKNHHVEWSNVNKSEANLTISLCYWEILYSRQSYIHEQHVMDYTTQQSWRSGHTHLIVIVALEL